MAGNIKGIIVEIGGNTTGLDKALKDVNKQCNSLQSELKTVDRLLKLDPNNLVLVKQKQDLLKDSISQTKDKLNTLKDAQAQVEQQFKNGTIGADQYRAFQRELEQTKQKLSSLKEESKSVSVIGTAMDGVKEKVSQLHSKLEPIEKGLKGIGETAGKISVAGIQTVGGAMDIAAKGFTAYVTAATGAAAAIGLATIKSYGELEQNLGGAEAVFGKYAASIQKTGEDAYRNLGVSQSQYLATANKMGALFQGSGVEQQKSLELTEKAMQRAADMASVMGIDMQVALDSVAGAAKGNFTMMDNLGVAMNATNIEAYALAKGLDFTWSTATQAEKAEVAMQMFFENTQQYAGNFAKESTQTISGSFGMLKASVSSLVAGLGNSQADIQNLAQNVVDALGSVAKNAMPIITNVAKAFPKVVESIIKETSNMLPEIITLITTELPNMMTSILQGFNTLVLGIIDAIITMLPSFIQTILPALITGFTDLVTGLVQALPVLIPLLLEGAIVLFMGLIDGLNKVVPMLMNQLPEMITQIVDTLIENLPAIIEGGMQLIIGLILGIANAAPTLITKIVELIPVVVKALMDNLPALVDAGLQLIIGVSKGIIQAIPILLKSLPEVINSIVNGLKGSLGKVMDIGKDMMRGIWDGIASMGSWLTNKVMGFFKGMLDGVKSFFGIHSPSTVFQDEVGKFLAQGIGVGFTGEIGSVMPKMKKSLSGLVGDIAVDMNTVGKNQLLVPPMKQNINLNVVSVMDGKQVGYGSAKYTSRQQSFIGGGSFGWA